MLAERVLGDGGGLGGLGRIGQVVAEREPHLSALRADADDDEAGLGGEAEQVRDDGDESGRGVDLYRRPFWMVVHGGFFGDE